MTINVTKPSVNLREKLNELETNKGLKGNEILQAETAQEVRSLIGAGRKNLIINGDFDVWQRGTSFTPTAANPYTADRWRVYQSSSSNVTVTKRTESTSSSVPFINYIRIDNTIDADTSWIELNQYVEDYSHLINNTVTLSFWAKASYDIQDGYTYTNSGTSSGVYAITTSWTKYQVTLDLKAGTVASNGYLRLLLGTKTSVNADSYIDYAQVQLELGSVATDFEHRSYGEELALCQRYFQKSYTDGIYAGTNTTVGIVIVNGSTEGGSSSYQYYTYPVPMRAAASITFYNSSGASGVWQGNSSPSSSATRTVALDYSGTAGFYFHVGLVNTWVVCQVYGHFTADAEL